MEASFKQELWLQSSVDSFRPLSAASVALELLQGTPQCVYS